MENIHLKLLNYNGAELEKLYNNPKLPKEFEMIKQLQCDLVEITRKRELNNAKLNDDYFPMPVNINRVLNFARSVHTDSNERYTDQEMFDEVMNLSDRIANIFLPTKEEIVYSEKYRSSNGTKLFRIYVHSELATMRIKDLNKQQLLFIIEDIELKFKKAIVNAGEMCGILAAQSIGELTTQLTLNTFHSAGISAKNVTLGVPRLKELINVTKKLKAPSLTMYEKDLVKDLNPTGQKRIVEGIRSSVWNIRHYRTSSRVLILYILMTKNIRMTSI
jgi:hypothetical protein